MTGEAGLPGAGDVRLGLVLELGLVLGLVLALVLGCSGTAGLPAGTGPTGKPGHLQVACTEARSMSY